MPEHLPNPFERMLDDHGAFVRGVARALVIDDPSADDVAQETWLAAMRHPPRRAGVRAWLGTVARNFSWRSHRDAARRASREERAARPEAAPARAEPLQATMLREVIEAVLALDEPYRSTVLMRFYENLDPSEIAARLGIPAATVRTRLKRALDQLRSRFDAAHGGDRRAWTAPLLPLALGTLKPAAAAAAAAVGGGTAAVAAASTYTGFTLGGIIMLKKVAIGATLAIIAAVSVYVATRPDTPVDDAMPPARPSVEVADATPDGAVPRIVPAAGPGSISPKPYVPGDEDRSAAEPAAAGKSVARASISGRVVDERGTPLANVPVSLGLTRNAWEDGASPTEISTERRTQANTGSDGRFVFEGLTPGFEVNVRARPEKLCDVVRATAITKAVPVDLGNLVATAGGSVAGTVLSPQGTAVKGCTVRAWAAESQSGAFGVFMLRDAGNDEARSAVTNAAGQYRIDGLPEGSCSVRVAADDYPEEARAGVRVRKNDVAWETDFKLSPGLTIAGVVRGADGEPVAGAEVTAAPAEIRIDDPSRPTAATRTATTGADGRFSINGLRSEGWIVRARKTGFVTATQRGVTPGTDVALTLEACGMAFGHVRNALTGVPIPSFSIKVSKEDFGMDNRLAARVLRGAEAAKAAGVEESPNLFAVVDLPNSPVKLEVRAEDFAEIQVGSVQAAPGAKIEIPVPMQPQALVRGFVVDSTGKAVEGAKVIAETPRAVEEPQPVGRSVRVKRRIARSDSAAPIEEPMVSRSAETGPDGSFAIKALPSGKYQLRASHRAFADAAPVELEIKPGETVDDVKLVVKLGGTLAGHALDADGKKLPGARIKVQPKSARSGGIGMLLGGDGREPVISDSEGAFEITGLEAGEYYASVADSPVDGQVRFAVAFDEEKPEGTLVTIEAGRTTRKDLQQKPRASVSGVVKEGGKPAAGVRVSMAVEGIPAMFGMPSAKTDEQGAFVIDNLAPGEYHALFDPPGAPESIRRPVTLAPRAEARLVVDLPTGAIEGRVVDLTTGKPMADVTVTAAAEKEQEGGKPAGAVMVAAIASSDGGGDIQTFSFGAPSQPVKTDADGRYRLSYVEPGKHKVSIRGAGITPQSRKGVAVGEGKTTKEIDFGAEKGATLVVTVDPAGRDVGGVFVFLEPQGGEENHDVKNGSTKAPIKFTGLKPGRYHVRADALGNDLEGSTEVEIVAGQETKATIRLEPK